MFLKNKIIIIFLFILSCQPIELIQPVKIENSKDYYITSDPNLLSEIEITEAQAKHKNLKESDVIKLMRRTL